MVAENHDLAVLRRLGTGWPTPDGTLSSSTRPIPAARNLFEHRANPGPLERRRAIEWAPIARQQSSTSLDRHGPPVASGNPRVVRLLLGHTKLESTVRYPGIEADDAMKIAGQIEIW